MPVVTPPSVTALPTPPSTASPSTFDSRADAFLTALPTFQTETDALAANVFANATDAAASATAAATIATSWVSGTTYVIGDVRWSPANFGTYRRKTAGAGTTDPSLDATNWASVINTANVTFSASTFIDYTETLFAPSAGSAFTVNLSNGTLQKFTTNANTTITLPTSSAGKSYTIMVAYGGVHSITWAGGSTIKWAGGSAPTATSVNGKFDLFVFSCDGVNTYARSGGGNY